MESGIERVMDEGREGGGSAICICVYGCAFKISRTIRLYNYLIEVREGETETERETTSERET